MLSRLAPLALLASLYLSSAMLHYKTLQAFGFLDREALMKQINESWASQEDAETDYRLAVKTFREIIDFDAQMPKRDHRQSPLADPRRGRRRTIEMEKRIAIGNKFADGLVYKLQRGFEEYANRGLKRSGEDLLEKAEEGRSGLVAAMRRVEAMLPSAPSERRRAKKR
jgi:hypothetical protein